MAAARSASAWARDADAWAAATIRMIPDSAVASPTAETRTRRLPPAATVPATTLSPGSLADRRGLAGDHRFVDVGAALGDDPVGGHPCPGSDEDDVAERQVCERDGLGAVAGHPLGGVGQELGQGRERAAGLGDRAHLEPMAEQHDRDEGRELPPDLDLEEAQRARPARDERDDDREADEGHHPRLSVGQLGPRAAQEDEPAVGEDDRPEDRRDERRAGEHRRRVAEPLLRVGAPDQDRDRQGEAQPELVPEHRDGVTGVAVMGHSGMRARHDMDHVGRGFILAGVSRIHRMVHRVPTLQRLDTPPEYPFEPWTYVSNGPSEWSTTVRNAIRPPGAH